MRNKLTNNLAKVIQNKIVLQFLFWILSYYILLHIFSLSSEIFKVDYIYTLVFIISLLLPVYVNLVELVPKLLHKKKYGSYLLAAALTLFAGVVFNLLLFKYLIDYILPGYYFISYFSFIDIIKFFITFMAITTLLRLSKEWFQLAETKQKLAEIEKEKIEIELMALKAQINPHFLFNSLNVLYSLALKNAKESPEAIIKLSDILRYVIYDSNKDMVKVSHEVKLINDYLSLQNYRIDKNANIQFETDIKTDNKISPMLFLPLVENSFKHGIKGDINETFVNIKLLTTSKITKFFIENNKGQTEHKENETQGGIGIANIKNRLQLIYPHQHKFLISESETVFKIVLNILHHD